MRGAPLVTSDRQRPTLSQLKRDGGVGGWSSERGRGRGRGRDEDAEQEEGKRGGGGGGGGGAEEGD